MKAYIIMLQGQGDVDVRVVDAETFAWVTSRDMGKPVGAEGNAWVDQLVPPSQLQKRLRDDDAPGELQITSGSWYNDRMLAAYNADGYDRDGYGSLRDAMRAIQKRGDEFEDSVEGMIY